MEKKLFSIGEISRIKRITKKALRFYERIGLLKPCYVDPRNRYRYYSIEQFIHIDIIKALRAMGISPADIKAVFKRRDTAELLEFLDLQKAKAEQQIDELRKTVGHIAGVRQMIGSSLSSVAHRSVYRRRLRQRSIVTLPFKGLPSPEAALVEFARFDRIIDEHRLISTYETGILFRPAEAGFAPALIFNTVDIVENSDAAITSTLPAGDYVCVCYNKDNASEQQAKLSKYCTRYRLQPTLLVQVDLLHDVFSLDANYLELQLLVQET